VCEETHLTALNKMDVGRALSVDGATHGCKTSAYRSPDIVQQPVHALAANVYLERVLRDAKRLNPYV